MRKGMMAAGALLVAVAVAWGASVVKPSAQSKGGAAVAYAKADIATGTLKCFGGKGTTTAYVSGLSIPDAGIELTFTGKYPKDITTDQVIVNVTPQLGVPSSVANAFVAEANPTQLLIQVAEWKSDTLAPVAGSVFLTVYLGHSIY